MKKRPRTVGNCGAVNFRLRKATEGATKKQEEFDVNYRIDKEAFKKDVIYNVKNLSTRQHRSRFTRQYPWL